VILLAASTAFGHSGPGHAPGDLRQAGAVDFAISCSAGVQAEFNRGVALLHSFFYEEARNIFTRIAEQDPACAMAQWGIAQTWWHPIWTPPTPDEMKAGTAAAERAMALKATPRERGYIEAINTYYNTPQPKSDGPEGQSCHGPVGPRDRVVAYEKAMKPLFDANGKDLETQVFYAFAVLAVGYATPLDTTLSNQKAAGAMLEALWKKHRRHPGIAHYIIHSYDYPSLAAKALEAANAYAAIAPWVPHALHMPSHIYTRLGMWDEAIAGNSASADASRSYAALRQRKAAEVEELHALDYMMYSYLQQGRDAEAREVLDTVTAVRETFPPLEFVGAYALGAMPARFALERGAWADAAALPIPDRPHWGKFPFVESLFEYAHALGRVRTGDVAGARQALERMQALHDATTEAKFDYFKKHLQLQMLAVRAWIAHAEGRSDEAVAGLQGAADAEDALGKHPVTPGALVPAREQLGELLLALKRDREALQAYEGALKIYPARFNGLYGAALAAERLGDRKLARKYYAALARQGAKSDGKRPGLAHVREYLAATASGVSVATP
jgi:tetratricopeptide (TPR) repeat protein